MQALELSFAVVFHTENCAVHPGNPTVSSVYWPTPRSHRLKAHPFLAIHSADEHRTIIFLLKYHFLLRLLCFLFFLSDNIMADVGRQTGKYILVFIHDSHAHKKTHRTDEKLTYLMGNLCCAREHSVQYSMQFLYTVKLHSLILILCFRAL